MNTLSGCGFVAIWNDVSRGTEEDFKDWHAHEHMPERLAIPGFLRGTRWGSAQAQPRYFTLYTLSGPEIARSSPYLDRLNAPTPWTRRVMNTFRDNSRCVGGFVASLGELPGREVIVCRLHGPVTDGSLIDKIMAVEGVSGCHMGLSDAATSALPTVERQGREVLEPQGLIIIALLPGFDKGAAVATLLPSEAAVVLATMSVELDMKAAQDTV